MDSRRKRIAGTGSGSFFPFVLLFRKSACILLVQQPTILALYESGSKKQYYAYTHMITCFTLSVFLTT
jgi:hypothetical protein